jgi:FtsZ-binding cell division protein ZapB
MDVVPLAVIGLVALGGLVAIAVGHKGWSWGTVVAAALLLCAATGYIYLAARLAERERAWRAVVSKNQAEIDKIVGSGMPGLAAEPKSLAALQAARDRWARARDFVDTWHGRRWTEAKFTPPRGGKPGSISIDMPGEEAEAGPVDAGAEVAVFDQEDFGSGGRFLGLFRVVKATATQGAENAVLSIVPASAPDAPGPAEIKHWTRNDVDVTVYESLPVDRWLGFHRTPIPAANAAGETPADAGTRWLPRPQKVAADDLLESLEQEIDAVKRHGQTVPEDDWKALFQQVQAEQRKGADRTLTPGLYWATVEFTRNVKFTKKEKFTADDAPPDAPAAGEEEDDEDEDIGAPGAPIEPGAPIAGETLSGSASPLEPTAGAATNRFKQRRYVAGELAEFDLETALELQDEKKWAKITAVVERRPLADPYTAIRGSRFEPFEDKDKKQVAVTSEGIDALRRGLIIEMASIEEAILKVAASRANVDRQAEALAEQKRQIDDDQTGWQRDLEASAGVVRAFDERLKAATIELAAMESTIVRLGRDLDAVAAELTRAVDAVAPPPGR